jgi:hypothetical protein
MLERGMLWWRCCYGENAAAAEEDTIVEVALDELVEGGRMRSGLLI